MHDGEHLVSEADTMSTSKSENLMANFGLVTPYRYSIQAPLMPDDSSIDQPNRLREWRTTRRLTMAGLARKISTTASQISKLEKGQVKLNTGWMTRLAAALDIRPVDLMVGAPPPPVHIDVKLLRHAHYIAEQALPSGLRSPIWTDTVGAVYDVLTEIKRESGQIEARDIDTLIRTHRRAHREIQR
jgi:transcriptional regulator with XRE-family HTH domain